MLLSAAAQIPKGTDPLAGVAGVNVRDAFAASRSFTLMAADYSQIEVRNGGRTDESTVYELPYAAMLVVRIREIGNLQGCR